MLLYSNLPKIFGLQIKVTSWSVQAALICTLLWHGSMLSLYINFNKLFSLSQTCEFLIMERSKTFPCYSSLHTDQARFDFGDCSKSYSFNGPRDNPEMERRKRVASYNMYAMEGKLKSSLRNSFKWIKSKFRDDYYDSSSG